VCNDFTPTLLKALGIHNLVTGEKGAANGALEKMAIGRLLVSASTPQRSPLYAFASIYRPDECMVYVLSIGAQSPGNCSPRQDREKVKSAGKEADFSKATYRLRSQINGQYVKGGTRGRPRNESGSAYGFKLRILSSWPSPILIMYMHHRHVGLLNNRHQYIGPNALLSRSAFFLALPLVRSRPGPHRPVARVLLLQLLRL